MVNFNGTFVESSNNLNIVNNRGFKYGDALFETLKVVNSKILFWEDHYFRLMASMRILRMEIPMNFTMEFLESEILKTLSNNSLEKNTAKVRLYIYRDSEGLYLPKQNTISYVITSESLIESSYSINTNPYEVDLFKDHFIVSGLLSTLKSTSKTVNVLASIYANENDLQNCLLLNTNKSVVEATNGNIFLVKDKTIKTVPLSDGCLNGITRKQLIDIITKDDDYTLVEASISPFELQKANEIFITNVISGIQPITKYRKKEFKSEVATVLLNKLNEKLV